MISLGHIIVHLPIWLWVAGGGNGLLDNTHVLGSPVCHVIEIHHPVTWDKPVTKEPVVVRGLRKFPYPYQAMLAVSSDADHQTIRKMWLIHSFLNTALSTPFGTGLQLDVADSFFMFNRSDQKVDVDIHHTPTASQLSYYGSLGDGQLLEANLIHAWIRRGWIDSLHSYGDFSTVSETKTHFRRGDAMMAIASLRAAGANISIWVDHGNRANVDNFGSRGVSSFFNYQQGAVPTSPYYHTDVLIPSGVHYVWVNRDGDVFGHESMLMPLKLPDGQRVWGFVRYTHAGWHRRSGTDWLWTVDAFAQQASPQHIHTLERRHQYVIVGQHLCADNEVLPLPKNAVSAFRFLAREQASGRLLVARTSRLLAYNVAEQCLVFEVTYRGGRAEIHLLRLDDPVAGPQPPNLDQLRGITFYTTNPDKTDLYLGDRPAPLEWVQRNPSDGTSPSIGIRWFDGGR